MADGDGVVLRLDDETAAFVDEWARERGVSREDVCATVFALGLGKAWTVGPGSGRAAPKPTSRSPSRGRSA